MPVSALLKLSVCQLVEQVIERGRGRVAMHLMERDDGGESPLQRESILIDEYRALPETV